MRVGTIVILRDTANRSCTTQRQRPIVGVVTEWPWKGMVHTNIWRVEIGPAQYAYVDARRHDRSPLRIYKRYRYVATVGPL